MKHEKKILPEYFQKILEGKKTYELRLADWECREGDLLVLREWNPATRDYTGRTLEKEVTYVGKTKDLNIYPQEDIEKFGYQIIAFDQKPAAQLKNELRFCLKLWKEKGGCTFGGGTRCEQCAVPYLLLKMLTGEVLHGDMKRLTLEDWEKKIEQFSA
jgi:ASC-1-like (ASCH) protein